MHLVADGGGLTREILRHPEDWPEATLSRVLSGEIVQAVECRLRHRDGGWRWCRLTLYPWRRGDERILGVEGIADDPRRADLEAISQESHRVAELVRRLLGLVRECGALPASVELPGLLEHTLRLLAYRFQQEHIAVVKEYMPDLPPVLGVRQELEQVLLNLLVNA